MAYRCILQMDKSSEKATSREETSEEEVISDEETQEISRKTVDMTGINVGQGKDSFKKILEERT